MTSYGADFNACDLYFGKLYVITEKEGIKCDQYYSLLEREDMNSCVSKYRVIRRFPDANNYGSIVADQIVTDYAAAPTMEKEKFYVSDVHEVSEYINNEPGKISELRAIGIQTKVNHARRKSLCK